MTTQPSIESLRAIIYEQVRGTYNARVLHDALSELGACRERQHLLALKLDTAARESRDEALRELEDERKRSANLLTRAEKAEASLDALQTWYGDHEEREAACCPEDTRCTDYIGLLLDTLKMIDATTAALRAERDALAARVGALVGWAKHDERCTSPAGRREVECWCGLTQIINSTPAADLSAHDASIRREALEAAWERVQQSTTPWFLERWPHFKEAILSPAPDAASVQPSASRPPQGGEGGEK